MIIISQMDPYVNRQICLINLQTNQQDVFYASLENIHGQLNLHNVISDFNSSKSTILKREFSLDPAQSQKLTGSYLLSPSFFMNNPLIVYYRQLAQLDIEDPHDNKKQRNKERTIREVILSIKRWRSFHKSKINGARVSLAEAAEMVGMSKKSLDDYFCQLRLGEQYDFDFRSHLDSKIGVLRAFVKNNRPKSRRSNKNQKHPKTLRIIEQIKDDEAVIKSQLPSDENTQKRAESQLNSVFTQSSQNSQQNQDTGMTPMEKQQEEQFENQFFQLDAILNEPVDPFVQYVARDYRDFKKKDYGRYDNAMVGEQGSEQTQFMW